MDEQTSLVSSLGVAVAVMLTYRFWREGLLPLELQYSRVFVVGGSLNRGLYVVEDAS